MSKNRVATQVTADHRTDAVATQPPENAAAEQSARTSIVSSSISEAPKSIRDEVGLIRLSQQGDRESFACLYDRYVDRIYRYVLFRVADEFLAEDITSHVFLKMWEKLPAYHIGPSPIAAWLYRVAHNAVIDHYRTRKTSVPFEDVCPAELAQNDPIDEELDLQARLEGLREALQQLTAGQRQVLILKFIEGFSVPEIALQLGKRDSAVRALQMRGLHELAKSPSLQKTAGPTISSLELICDPSGD